MKKDKLFYSVNSDILMKGAVLLGSAGIALLLDANSKKKNQKRKGFIARTARINNNLTSLATAFYVHGLKKEAENVDFPIKIETADIIEM